MKREEITAAVVQVLMEDHKCLLHNGQNPDWTPCRTCTRRADLVARKAVVPLVADAELAVRQAVWVYCETAAVIAEENVANPYAVGLAKGYRDIQEKLAPALARAVSDG